MEECLVEKVKCEKGNSRMSESMTGNEFVEWE